MPSSAQGGVRGDGGSEDNVYRPNSCDRVVSSLHCQHHVCQTLAHLSRMSSRKSCPPLWVALNWETQRVSQPREFRALNSKHKAYMQTQLPSLGSQLEHQRVRNATPRHGQPELLGYQCRTGSWDPSTRQGNSGSPAQR